MSTFHVLLILCLDRHEMAPQRFLRYGGKHRDPVLISFSSAHHNLIAGKIDILHPQAEAFHKPKTCPVQEHGHQPLGASETPKNGSDFLPSEHNREMARPFGSHHTVNIADGLFQHFAVQEYERIERLVLGGGADMRLSR